MGTHGQLGPRVERALDRFAAFFTEVGERFVERDDLITQIALALLAREHVLVTGPPGTGKSALVAATLGRIVRDETGEPSLFAKQFTESTVQTELIGPVDFRTLTETGRMEHFTDEGMLGAVHAFLDEVLDGRDMLLRSTLNILEERELKQGTKITRGLIECAVMTSNRYLAEVLEESRVALLAFVDRIAFVGFVPRGFAEPARLEGLVARALERGDGLTRRLTVEDVDELQVLVEEVQVPARVASAALALGRAFDQRTADLERADPTFSATRYFSTRAYIRIAKLLRVVVVFDKATRRRERSLVATRDDLGLLRLSLMLAGPQPEHIEALLAHESDPRERRQLELMRAELEIFRECLRTLPNPPAPAATEAPDPGSPPSEERPTTKLEARRLAPLTEAVLALSDRPGDLASIAEVAALADDLERQSPGTRAAAVEARGRAMRSLAATLAFAALPGQSKVSAEGSTAAWAAAFEIHLGTLEAAAELRDRLRAGGANDEGDIDACFGEALARLRSDLEVLTDAWAHEAAPAPTDGSASAALAAAVEALEPVAERLRPLEARVRSLGSEGRVANRTLARRLAPLLAATYGALDRPKRDQIAGHVDQALDAIQRLDLLDAVPRPDHLDWVARALVRGATSTPAEGTGLAGYRALRSEDRVPRCYALAEIVGLLAQRSDGEWDGELGAVRRELTALSPEVQALVAAADLDHLESLAAYVERWAESEERGALLEVVFEEKALLRSSLECRLVADLFPSAADRAQAMGERLRTTAQRLLSEVDEERRRSVDTRWAALTEG